MFDVAQLLVFLDKFCDPLIYKNLYTVGTRQRENKIISCNSQPPVAVSVMDAHTVS